jgi:hypothetical protein
VRFAIATFHVPHAEGAAAGRQLWALAESLQADGHELTGWCWGPLRPGLAAPEWCEHRPFEPSGPRHRPANLLFPRTDVGRVAWQVPDDAVLWADDWSSWPVVDRPGRPALLTVHYDVGLDRRALGQRSLPWWQDWRAQRRAVRRSPCTVALSRRVADAARVDAVVPATLPIPDAVLPLVEEPVALLLADWTWPANVASLRTLMSLWPAVRSRVPGARLHVAGRGSDAIAAGDGVRIVGEVAHSADAMREAAALAFPCPPTSGPKMKVLDAVVSGLPVVTTPAGAEGLMLADGAIVTAELDRFAEALSAVLADPARRAAMADSARLSALDHHAPVVAARARVEIVGRNCAVGGELFR